jgi:hypothetical protein
MPLPGRYFLWIIILSFFACKAKEKKLTQGCDHLREGTFEYRNYLTNGRISIERNDSMQTEKDFGSGIDMLFKVTWITPCEYHLKFISMTGGNSQGYDPRDAPLVRSEIIKVTPNYYITRTRSGSNPVHVDTLLIIK